MRCGIAFVLSSPLHARLLRSRALSNNLSHVAPDRCAEPLGLCLRLLSLASRRRELPLSLRKRVVDHLIGAAVRTCPLFVVRVSHSLLLTLSLPKAALSECWLRWFACRDV